MFDINCPMNTINTAIFIYKCFTHNIWTLSLLFFLPFPQDISLSLFFSTIFLLQYCSFFLLCHFDIMASGQEMQRMIGVHLIFPLPNSPSIVSLFILSFLALFSHNLTFVFDKVISCFLSSHCLSYLATVRVKSLISMDQKHL